MLGSLVVGPVCGGIVLVGALLGAVVALILYHVFRNVTSATDRVAAIAGTSAGVMAFVVWFVLAWSVLFLLATFLISET